MQHIEDGKRLSRELGGTDVDVKKYFFSLAQGELDPILTEYGERFGSQAEEYARKAMPQWQSGKVQMSGTVAERLFKLLPPHMPISAKYKLTESLWTHFGPSSKKRLRIGINSDLNTALVAIDNHIEQVVTAYQIPKELEARFEWLSQGDVGAKQQLLNHFRSLECRLVSDGARLQLPVMINHFKSSAGDLTQRMAQILKIGKHELELLIDRDFESVAMEEWRPELPTKSTSGGNGWIVWLVIIAVLLILFKR
jgi:hypothetical protein